MPHFLRPQLLPVLISNLCSFYGLLFLHWSVADLFFWFWFEFALAGLVTLAFTVIWSSFGADRRHPTIRLKPYIFTFSFLLILFYATLFAAMAYRTEWKSWGRFPEFLGDKHIQMLATIGSFVFYFAAMVARPDYGESDWSRIELQFGRRSMVIVALYLLLQIKYYYFDSARLNMTPAFLLGLGVALLALKTLSEVGLFDRLFTRRVAALP